MTGVEEGLQGLQVVTRGYSGLQGLVLTFDILQYSTPLEQRSTSKLVVCTPLI